MHNHPHQQSQDDLGEVESRRNLKPSMLTIEGDGGVGSVGTLWEDCGEVRDRDLLDWDLLASYSQLLFLKLPTRQPKFLQHSIGIETWPCCLAGFGSKF